MTYWTKYRYFQLFLLLAFSQQHLLAGQQPMVSQSFLSLSPIVLKYFFQSNTPSTTLPLSQMLEGSDFVYMTKYDSVTQAMQKNEPEKRSSDNEYFNLKALIKSLFFDPIYSSKHSSQNDTNPYDDDVHSTEEDCFFAWNAERFQEQQDAFGLMPAFEIPEETDSAEDEDNIHPLHQFIFAPCTLEGGSIDNQRIISCPTYTCEDERGNKLEVDSVEDNIDEGYMCPACLNICNDPVVCCREMHAVCRQCLGRTLGELKSCPICREQGKIISLPIIKRIINNFEVYCPNKATGCSAITKIGDVFVHLTKCPFAELPCSDCNIITIRSELDKHAEICQLAMVSCFYCNEIMKRKEVPAHEDYCLAFPLECTCGETITMSCWSEHLLSEGASDNHSAEDFQKLFKWFGQRTACLEISRKSLACENAMLNEKVSELDSRPSPEKISVVKCVICEKQMTLVKMDRNNPTCDKCSASLIGHTAYKCIDCYDNAMESREGMVGCDICLGCSVLPNLQELGCPMRVEKDTSLFPLYPLRRVPRIAADDD